MVCVAGWLMRWASERVVVGSNSGCSFRFANVENQKKHDKIRENHGELEKIREN